MPLEGAVGRQEIQEKPIWGYACALERDVDTTADSSMVAHDCLGGLVDLVRSTAGTPPPRLAHFTAPCATCHAMQHISLRLRVCTDILERGPLTPASLNACARALSVGVHRLFDAHIDRRPPPCAVAGLSLTSCHTTVRRSAAHASTASSSRTRSDAPLRSYALAVSATRGKPLPRHRAPRARTHTHAPRPLYSCVCALTCTVAH